MPDAPKPGVEARIAALEENLRRLQQARDDAVTQAQQAHADQYLLRAVIEGTSHPVFVKDLASRYLLFNPAAEQVTGKRAAEVLGRDDAAVFPPAAAQRIREHDRQVIAAGENGVFEEELPDAQGNLRTFLTTKGPVRDAAGNITGIYGIARDITDLKRAEARLRESEERFRLVFNQQFQFMAILAPDGIVLEINDLPLRVTGFARADYLGKFFWDSPGWRDLPEWQKIWPERLEQAAQMDGPLLTEDIYQGADGSIRQADAATSAARDREGKIKYFIIQAVDTTERKRVEAALRESEQRCQLVYRATNDLIWDLELSENRIVWTGAVQEVLGYGEQEFSPALDAWAAHLHPDDRGRVVAGLQAAIDGAGARWSDEYRLRRKDGSYAVFFDRGFIVRNEAGKALRMIGSMQDITQRKRLEAERDHLMSELEAIIQFLPEGLVLYDAEGNIVHLNPAADTLLSYSPEFRRKPFAERNVGRWKKEPGGEALPLQRLPVTRALRGEIVQTEPLAYSTPDDRLIWLNVSAAPIYSPGGELQGAVAVYSDIGRLRQLQEEKQAYLHTISHDLRTPLTVIQGHADLLRPALEKVDLGELPRLSVEAIQKACRQMTRMMEDLSEMARLEGGEVRLQPTAIELGRFVADYLRRTQVALDVSRLRTDIPADLPPAWADPQALERCLGNLVSNAVKYAEGETPVRISARARGNELVVAVRDQGPGIVPEDLPHVFERFFRARKAKKQGLGLGLFITRSLVEAQNGRIWVESAPGHGSTFSFSLPQATAEAAAGRRTPMAEADRLRPAPMHYRGDDARIASGEVWKRLVDSDLVGIVIGDFQGNILAANDYYLDLLGHTREELMAGRIDWRNLTPPEHRQAEERALEQLRSQGFGAPYEKEYVRKDGSRVSVLLANALLPGGQIAAFVLNVTECKRLERQLRESDLRFQAFLDNATSAIFLKDREGRLLLVNRSFEKFYGLPAAALLGKRFEDFCADRELAAAVRLHDRSVLESGEAVAVEEVIHLADGAHVFLTSKFPLRDAQGGIYGLGGIATDVTERKGQP